MKAYKASSVWMKGDWYQVFDTAGTFAFAQGKMEAARIATQCTKSGCRMFLRMSGVDDKWVVMFDDVEVARVEHRKDARALMLKLRRKAASKKLRVSKAA